MTARSIQQPIPVNTNKHVTHVVSVSLLIVVVAFMVQPSIIQFADSAFNTNQLAWIGGFGIILPMLMIVCFWPLYVREKQVAIIYRRFGHFQEYKPPGLHFIPITQVVKGVIDTSIQPVSDKVHVMIEGFEVKIEWSGAMVIDPFNIGSNSPGDVAHLLRTIGMKGIAKSSISDTIRKYAPEHDIYALGQQGMQARLEQDLKETAQERLEWGGVNVFKVNITRIQTPPKLSKMIESKQLYKHERKLAWDKAQDEARIRQYHSQSDAYAFAQFVERIDGLPAEGSDHVHRYRLGDAMNKHGVPSHPFVFHEMGATHGRYPPRAITAERGADSPSSAPSQNAQYESPA